MNTRIIPMDRRGKDYLPEREETMAYREDWRNQVEDVLGNEILVLGESGLTNKPAIDATLNEHVQKGLVFKLATDAGRLAWNSSHAMSVGTTKEREIFRLNQDVMSSISNSPEARLARMVQTVMEADMRGMPIKAVVAEMREEGQRLWLVDTDVDVVLGLAGDAYANMAATRNAEMFDDGIHSRLVNRALLVTAALQGHDSVAEAEKSFLNHYVNHAAAYSNNQEAVKRLVNRESLERIVVESPAIQNASIHLRDGIKTRESITQAAMADMKLDMACAALSKIQGVPGGVEGERMVGAMLLRVENSVNDRLYGRAGMDNPPSKNEAFGIMLQVKDAFTAGAKGAGHQFAAAFKETLDSITTQVGTFMAATQIKQESSKNQDLNAG